MIQELLGEAATGLIGPERPKLISVPAGVSPSPSPSQSPSPSPSPSSSTTTTPTTSSTSENLRCPRCDSTNTKFCYYNNYNLTQPRHFCKTCRRYWTKGGALRNVPIGGGCRKNKTTSITSAAAAKTNAVKLKTMSAEIGKPSFISSFEHELSSSSPILFASPQNSHLLSLLRANSNPNPNPSPLSNSATIKDEPFLFQSHLSSESPLAGSSALNARILGLDPLLGPVSSVWRNNQHQTQQQNGFINGELQSSGFQDFYQRIRSSTNYYQDHASAVVGNTPGAASTSTSTILESAPVGAAELGYWNPVLSWSDLPTTHGAYP